MTLAELQLMDPTFFQCGFCQAVAPKEGRHVCGDKYSVDRITALRLREQKERRLQMGKTGNNARD